MSEQSGSGAGRAAGERVLVRNASGRVVAEILFDGERFHLWKRERPRFPPRNRHVPLGTFASLEEARRRAEEMED